MPRGQSCDFAGCGRRPGEWPASGAVSPHDSWEFSILCAGHRATRRSGLLGSGARVRVRPMSAPATTVLSVETDLCRLHVESIGSGPAILCWPSLFCDGRTFASQVEALAGTHRLLVVDGAGHGTQRRAARPLHPRGLRRRRHARPRSRGRRSRSVDGERLGRARRSGGGVPCARATARPHRHERADARVVGRTAREVLEHVPNFCVCSARAIFSSRRWSTRRSRRRFAPPTPSAPRWSPTASAAPSMAAWFTRCARRCSIVRRSSGACRRSRCRRCS